MSSPTEMMNYEEQNIWTNPDFDLQLTTSQIKKPKIEPWWVVKMPKGKTRYGSLIHTSSYCS